MVKVKDDLVGKRFGRLVVLERSDDYVSPKGYRLPRWKCQCDCGSEPITVQGSALKSQHTQSCGCLNREISAIINKKYNQYDLSGEYGIGWTSNTNKEFYFDLEDYDKIKNYCWCEFFVQGKYSTLRTNKDGRPINMHQLLGFKRYDHINRNELDNRKINLREATDSENMQNRSLFSNNTSGVMGVTWDNSNKRWRAFITVNHTKFNLGSFINKEDAIKARLEAEDKYCGEFAAQKHLFEEYGIISRNSCEVVI